MHFERAETILDLVSSMPSETPIHEASPVLMMGFIHAVLAVSEELHRIGNIMERKL